jgi:hypothetical protein
MSCITIAPYVKVKSSAFCPFHSRVVFWVESNQGQVRVVKNETVKDGVALNWQARPRPPYHLGHLGPGRVALGWGMGMRRGMRRGLGWGQAFRFLIPSPLVRQSIPLSLDAHIHTILAAPVPRPAADDMVVVARGKRGGWALCSSLAETLRRRPVCVRWALRGQIRRGLHRPGCCFDRSTSKRVHWIEIGLSAAHSTAAARQRVEEITPEARASASSANGNTGYRTEKKPRGGGAARQIASPAPAGRPKEFEALPN